MSVDVAQQLKVDGQERSAARLTDEHRALFERLVLARRPGDRFTVNDLRAQLDAAGVPNVSRAALFAGAAAAGLIEQVTLVVGGQAYPARIPSTGQSAHRATVLVWRRLDDAEAVAA